MFDEGQGRTDFTFGFGIELYSPFFLGQMRNFGWGGVDFFQINIIIIDVLNMPSLLVIVADSFADQSSNCYPLLCS